MKTKSNFWDHSQTWVWKWFFQMLFNRNVYFFYDFKKKCFVRKVTHVKGEIIWDINEMHKVFSPDPNRIVDYKQWIHDL